MKCKIFAIAMVFCFMMLAGTTVAGNQHGQQDDLVLTTNRDWYMQGDMVMIKLTNRGDEAVIVHPDLETMTIIYDMHTGQEVKMAGPEFTEIAMLLPPGRSINWVWDQTYWMYEFTPDGIVYSRSNGMQVPATEYGITVMGLDVETSITIYAPIS